MKEKIDLNCKSIVEQDINIKDQEIRLKVIEKIR